MGNIQAPLSWLSGLTSLFSPVGSQHLRQTWGDGRTRPQVEWQLPPGGGGRTLYVFWLTPLYRKLQKTALCEKAEPGPWRDTPTADRWLVGAPTSS